MAVLIYIVLWQCRKCCHIYDYVIKVYCIATSNISSLGTITTDLNDAKSFTLGSTLTIDGSADYIDGLYSGTYPVEVAY
jgi:hypothetical protein